MKIKLPLTLSLLVFLLFISSCGSHRVKTQENNKKDEKSYIIIEKVPIFPGCEEFEDYVEATNNKLRDCLSQKVQEHIHKNFGTSLGTSLGLEGIQRILVTFTIDTTGSVVDVIANGPHFILESEAKRVMSLLPQFTPGEHRGKKVDVPFTLPIRYEVEKVKDEEI